MDMDKMSPCDIDKIEELSGQSISSLGDEGTPKGKLMAALAFVAKRKEDPTFTFNAALALTLEEASDTIGLDELSKGPKKPNPNKPNREQRRADSKKKLATKKVSVSSADPTKAQQGED